MTRLFSFGCSFTNYKWPTWANILSLSYDHFQNWAMPGFGNHAILYSLTESISRNQISRKDVVYIMWTTIAREDRWINGKWLADGSVYDSNISKKFGNDYLDNFTDPTGFLLTNLSVIDSARRILDSIGCEYYFLSMVPLYEVDDSQFRLSKLLKFDKTIDEQAAELYSETLSLIKPSIFDLVFGGDWNKYDKTYDMQFTYDKAKKRYDLCRGQSWPAFDVFLNARDSISKNVLDEISKFDDFDKLLQYRVDTHPRPHEHLEYLDKLGIPLSQEQCDFANLWSSKLATDYHGTISEWETSLPKIKRF